jgi:hypothetical protein
MEDAKAALQELATIEETEDTEDLLVVESFSVLGRSAALRIVRPSLEYGGNKSAARPAPSTETTSWRRSSVE